MAIPDAFRMCLVSKRGLLNFFRWFPQSKRLEEDQSLRHVIFPCKTHPQTVALSSDRICVGYEKSYIIFSLIDGKIINSLDLSKRHSPMINRLQDPIQWCIQLGNNTVFLDSNFEPAYESGIIWTDIPSAVVQSNLYVLALINQSIDICLFNGKQPVVAQRISQICSSTEQKKCRLWMDNQSKRIYLASPSNIYLLEPIPIHIQIQQYISINKYDLALMIIRAALDIHVCDSSSIFFYKSRTPDGHAKGKLDLSKMSKVMTFSKHTQISVEVIVSSFSSEQSWDESRLWLEYYRIGSMYAFQLFHREQFQQAFAEFQNFLTDPVEIICLFEQLSANRWLSDSYKNFTAFIEQHPHFSQPMNFVGEKFHEAVRELQFYLTETRAACQKISRRSPHPWLEVRSQT